MEISTSILNSKDRKESVNLLNKTQTKYIHIDVMDGIFVEDKQFTIDEIKELNKISNKKLDIHLMVENPIEYIEKLNNLNVEYITFHIEVGKDINNLIDKIKELGYKVGISIKPNTDINLLIPYLDKIDLILIMSVEPGKGGQSFLPNTPSRIKEIKELIKDRNILLEVDGGINDETICKIKESNIAVVGSYIIKSNNYNKQIKKLLPKERNYFYYLVTTVILLIVMYIILCLIVSINASINGYKDGFCSINGGDCNLIYGKEAFENSMKGMIILPAFLLASPVIPIITIAISIIRYLISKSKTKKTSQ